MKQVEYYLNDNYQTLDFNIKTTLFISKSNLNDIKNQNLKNIKNVILTYDNFSLQDFNSLHSIFISEDNLVENIYIEYKTWTEELFVFLESKKYNLKFNQNPNFKIYKKRINFQEIKELTIYLNNQQINVVNNFIIFLFLYETNHKIAKRIYELFFYDKNNISTVLLWYLNQKHE